MNEDLAGRDTFGEGGLERTLGRPREDWTVEDLVDLFRRVARRQGLPLYRWMASEGLQRLDEGAQAYPEYRKPAEALAQIRALSSPGIFLLLDLHPYLKDPLVVRLLRDIASGKETVGDTSTLEDYSVLAQLRESEDS